MAQPYKLWLSSRDNHVHAFSVAGLDESDIGESPWLR